MISVLIPTYNAEPYIRELLDRLLSQELPGHDLEIIIVDSSSSDNTMEIVKQYYTDVRIYSIPNRTFDHGGTRNLMASKANGDYLLFMTQDAIPYDSFLLRNLIKPFEDNEVAISFARQIPKPDAKELECFARGFNYPEQSIIKNKQSLPTLGIKTFFNSNVCSMYRADLFREFGGFPEKIILNEDMILSSKMILQNYKVSYTASAKVYHSHNYDLTQQFKRYFDIGMAFHETSYLLKYASNEKEGIKMVKTQMIHLMKAKKPLLIPYAVAEAFSKWFGYQLGKRHEKLPLKLKKQYSAYMKS